MRLNSFQSCSLLAAILLVASGASAQTPTQRPDLGGEDLKGKLIRITTSVAAIPVVGRLVSVDDRFVMLRNRDGRHEIDVDLVDRIEWRKRIGNEAKGGAIVGFFVGLIPAILTGLICSDADAGCSAVPAGVFTAGVFTLSGTLLGAYAGRYQWMEVPINSTQGTNQHAALLRSGTRIGVTLPFRW